MTKVVKSIICDCCKKEYDEEWHIGEFLCYNDRAGYDSAFPDGCQLELDLCSKCVKKLLGKYIRIDGKKGNRNGKRKTK